MKATCSCGAALEIPEPGRDAKSHMLPTDGDMYRESSWFRFFRDHMYCRQPREGEKEKAMTEKPSLTEAEHSLENQRNALAAYLPGTAVHRKAGVWALEALLDAREAVLAESLAPKPKAEAGEPSGEAPEPLPLKLPEGARTKNGRRVTGWLLHQELGMVDLYVSNEQVRAKDIDWRSTRAATTATDAGSVGSADDASREVALKGSAPADRSQRSNSAQPPEPVHPSQEQPAASGPVETDPTDESLTDKLRAKGWMVAVHNDYRQDGKLRTFWLFTKDGKALKGEGDSDSAALLEVCRQLPGVQELYRATPPAQDEKPSGGAPSALTDEQRDSLGRRAFDAWYVPFPTPPNWKNCNPGERERWVNSAVATFEASAASREAEVALLLRFVGWLEFRFSTVAADPALVRSTIDQLRRELTALEAGEKEKR